MDWFHWRAFSHVPENSGTEIPGKRKEIKKKREFSWCGVSCWRSVTCNEVLFWWFSYVLLGC